MIKTNSGIFNSERRLTALRCASMIAAMAVATEATANTVLWYRFEEHDAGYVMTSADRVTNEANAGTMQGVPYASSYGYPSYTATPQGHQSIYDPVSGQMFPNKTGIYFTPVSTASTDNGGSKANGPRIEVADDAALHLDAFTIEMFLYRDGQYRAAPDTIISKYIGKGASSATGNPDVTRYAYHINRAAANSNNHWFQLNYRKADGYWGTTVPSSDPLHGNIMVKKGYWDHLAIVSDVANQTVKVYLNYVLLGEKTISEGSYMDYGSGQPLLIGSDSYGSFGGCIDEFRISDVALSPSQFLRLCSPNALPETTHYVDFSAASNITAVVTNTAASTTKAWFVNAAPVAGSKTSAELRNKTLDSGIYTVNDGLPGDDTRAALLSDFADANLAAVHIQTNNSAQSYSGVVELRGVSELNNSSATIEFFFKAKNTMTPTERNPNDTGDNSCAYLFACLPLYVNVARSSREVVFAMFDNKWGYSQTVGRTLRIDDGVWHHFAYVFDKDEGTEVYYLDGMRMFGQQKDVYKTNHSFTSSSLYLGDNWSGSINKGLSTTDTVFDEIRITKKALRPCEFLTSVPKEEGNTLAWYSFENDSLANGAYDDVIGAGALAAYAGGTSAFSPKTPGDGHELWDSARNKIRDNFTSVSFAGGKAVWPRNSLLEREDLTVEFFARENAASANAGLVSLLRSDSGTNSTAIAESDAMWSIRVGSDGKTPEVYVNNGSAQIVAFPAASALGGNWRHYAVVFAPSGNDTTVKLYCDQTLAATQTITGKIQLPSATGGAIPMLGTKAGASSGAAFNGSIDEVRISLGEVDVADFLYAPPPGATVIYMR